ncbi:hypothetical protein ACOSQ2_002684 [Xanthoceras sorbifolium]
MSEDSLASQKGEVTDSILRFKEKESSDGLFYSSNPDNIKSPNIMQLNKLGDVLDIFQDLSTEVVDQLNGEIAKNREDLKNKSTNMEVNRYTVFNAIAALKGIHHHVDSVLTLEFNLGPILICFTRLLIA